MVSNFTESMRANFSQLRELQSYFNESIVNLCVATVERIMKGELDDELPDDIREVCRRNTISRKIFFSFVFLNFVLCSFLPIKTRYLMLVKRQTKFIGQK